MSDDMIIKLFFSRDEHAIRELDKKYGQACQSISFNILHNRSDAQECVNDAYLGIWNAIPPEKPRSLFAYLLKIVRNISLDRYERNTAKKRNSYYDMALEELGDCIPAPCSVEDIIIASELTAITETFLGTLTKENRVIFLRRYYFADQYRDISQKTGLSEKNVSVRLTRIRKELKKYLEKRGFLL